MMEPRAAGLMPRAAPALIGAAVLVAACSVRPVDRAAIAPVELHEASRFTIACHFPCGAVVADAVDAAENAWALAEALFSTGEDPLREAGTIHLYATTEHFRAVDRAIARGRFRDQLAFTSHQLRQAHIAVQPELSEAALARVGLPYQTRRLIAHEAIHLAQSALLPELALPQAIREGAATWGEREVARALDWIDDPSEDPWSAMHQWLVARLLREGRLPTAQQIFDDRLEDLSTVERYAVWGLFFETLVGEVEAASRGVFRHALGFDRAALAALDQRFRAKVAALAPAWIEARRTLDTGRQPWVQAGFGREGARAWRNETIAGDRFAVEGAAELVSGRPEDEMQVLLERPGDGPLAVVLRPGQVFIESRAAGDRDGDGGRLLGQAVLPRSDDAGPIPFRVELAGDELRVAVGGATRLVVVLEEDPPAGRWGLGVNAGAAGLWHGVEAEGVER